MLHQLRGQIQAAQSRARKRIPLFRGVISSTRRFCLLAQTLLSADPAAVSVSSGTFHTCAVAGGGELACFGGNLDGIPAVPSDLGPVSAVSAGAFHTCAIRADARPYLNIILNSCSLYIFIGNYKNCNCCKGSKTAEDGELVCFGLEDYGRCNVPEDLGPVLAVSANMYHTCAVRADGRLLGCC